jgi:integrase
VAVVFSFIGGVSFHPGANREALVEVGLQPKGYAAYLIYTPFDRTSPHGMRATASTLLNEIGFRPDVIERQLAHTERNRIRATYNRAEYLEERREMMQYWADFIDGLCSGKVVPLKKRTA